MKTPEISVFHAQKEIEHFAVRMSRVVGMVKELTHTTDDEAFQSLYDRIAKYEQISDNMENEIGKYLGQVANAHLSDDTKQTIRAMLREIGELESIGDSFFNLARALMRKKKQNVTFTASQEAGLTEMYGLVGQSMDQMVLVLEGEADESESTRLEIALNACRDRLRQQNENAVDERDYSYACSTIYMDLVEECEQCGDYIVNVVEARTGREMNKKIQ
jgi:phosphate:Na+ symporter